MGHLGATIVMMPRFDLEQILGLIQKYRVTLAHRAAGGAQAGKDRSLRTTISVV
jgi:hypothetical protein